MNTIFGRKELSCSRVGLTYDDVLLVPRKSEVRSRRNPNLGAKITKLRSLQIPIISANMDTVTESEMAIAMNVLGGMGIIHRFLSIENQVAEVRKVADSEATIISASLGVNDDFKERARALVDAGVNVLTIDIAHGHSIQMLETLKFLKDSFPGVEVIAGNISTPEAAEELIEAAADSLKVGIGPGSMCSTRVITGCGVPQMTAVAFCTEVADAYGVPVIADGGIKSSGDIVKALAAGAQTVMLGNLLSGTMETPGDIKSGHKIYRGMASKSAQVSWRGVLPEGMAPEGESTRVSVKGRVRDVVMELCGGIRSGMSYLNAETITELQNNARFIQITSHGVFESKPHGLEKGAD